jgi:hypothetical protein
MKILEPDNTLIFSNFETSYILKYNSDDDAYSSDGEINFTIDINNITNEKIENIVIYNSYIKEQTDNIITFPYHIKNIYIIDRNIFSFTDINKLKIPFGCEIVKDNDRNWKFNEIDDYYMFGCGNIIPTEKTVRKKFCEIENFSNHL